VDWNIRKYQALRTALRGGAGGKHSKKRKQNESGGGQLATALTTFLKDWSEKRPEPKKFSKQRDDSELARSLIQILKNCLNKGSNDGDVVNTVLHHVQQWQSEPDETDFNREMTKKPRVSYYEAQTNRQVFTSRHSTYREDWDGHQGNTGQQMSYLESWPKPSETHVKAYRKSMPKCASKLDVTQWTEGTKLTTLTAVEKALVDGVDLPGNVIIARDEQVKTEISRLWQAHGCTKEMTLATASQDPTKGPLLQVWWGPNTKDVRPKMERLSILHLGEKKDGPTPISGKRVTLPAKEKPQMATVRIMAPQFYRCFVPGAPKQDDPTSIISELAQATQAPVHKFTGGYWQKVSHKHGTIYIAHLRLPSSLGDKLVQLSGKRGIFVSKMPTRDEPRKQVIWIEKPLGTETETYFQTAKKLADSSNLPMALRQGGNSDIGLVGAKEGDVPNPTRPKMFCIRGAPRNWCQEDIEMLLGSQGWTNLEVVSRRRSFTRGNEPEWFVKARAPNGSQNFWHYEDDSCHVTVSPSATKARNPKDSEWINGPVKRWVDHKRPEKPAHEVQSNHTISSTVLDTQTQESNLDPQRERSPKRQDKTKKDTNSSLREQPDDQLIANCPDNWRILDYGGSGDCAFRCVAQCLAQNQQKKDLCRDSAEREGARLRTLAVKELASCRLSKKVWVHDPQETVSMRGGIVDPPKTFEEYLELAAMKKFYADGWLIQALAISLKTDIIVWKHHNEVWERYVILGSREGQDRSKRTPICLTLKDVHYRCLLKPQHDSPIPEFWMQMTRRPSSQELRGAGPGSVLSLEASTTRSVLSLPSEPGGSSKLSLSQISSAPGVKHWRPLKRCTFKQSSCDSRMEDSLSFAPPSLDPPKACGIDPNPASSSPATSSKGFREDTMAYPRPKGKRTKQIKKDTRPQEAQVWTCPICTHTVNIPAGPDARFKLRYTKTNHMMQRHSSEERQQYKHQARIGQQTQIFAVSQHIPMDQRSWTCSICQGGLPYIEKKHHLTVSIAEHKKQAHPDASFDRNKAKRTLDKTETLSKASKHELVGILLNLHPGPQNEDNTEAIHMCKVCLVAGGRKRFHNWKCERRSVAPLYTITKLRKLIVKDPANIPRIQKALGKNKKDWVETRIVPDNKHSNARVGGPGLAYKGVRVGEAKNPGPPTLEVISLNVQGGPGVKRAIEGLLQDKKRTKPGILALQEAACSNSEIKTMTRLLTSCDYNTYYVPGTTTPDRWGQMRARGGVLTAVHRELKQRKIAEFSDSFQHLIIEIDKWYIINSYVPPRPGLADTAAQAAQEMFLQHGCAEGNRPWLWVGDFNEDFDESCAHTVAQQFQGNAVGPLHLPSRWKSKATDLDLVFCNQLPLCSNVTNLTEVLSDHIAKSVTISHPWQLDSHRGVLQNRGSWKQPPSISSTTWTELLDYTWKQGSDAQRELYHLLDSPNPDVNLEWETFLKAVHNMFDDTAKTLALDQAVNNSVEFLKWLQSCRMVKARNTPPKHVRVSRRNTRRLGSMQERKRRNRLAKLARLHQLLTDRPGDREIHGLRKKLHLDATDASTSDLFLQVQQEIGRLRTQICQEDQETKRVAIQKWRQDMRHNLTARYKWIRRGQECPHLPTLASNGETFLGDEKSIAAITNHWRSTWNAARHRAQLSLPQQLNMVQELLQPLHHEYAGTRPTMADLIKAVKRLHGAPGPDQWTCLEIRVLPLNCLKTFHFITERWEIYGQTPQAIQDSKQVNLPKANKVSEDNFLDPKNTRPINIYSCWYRLFASMWAQSDSMKQWYKETLPSSILGGPETKGADMVTSELHDLLHIEGFFATLDLSQAFDNIQADVATTSMRTLGIPPRLTGVLRHQWLHQRRWMTWNRCVSETEVNTDIGIPQGDPLSPLAMNCVMTLGVKSVERDLTPIVPRHFVWMDDRSFILRTPRHLVQTCDSWFRFSSNFGFRENEHKAQLVAATSHRENKLRECLLDHDLLSRILPYAEVLGSHVGKLTRSLRPLESQRVSLAKLVAQRIALLPLPRVAKLETCRATVLSRAAYGWTGKRPTKELSKSLDQAVHKACGGFKQSPPALRRLLEGGTTVLEPVVGTRHLMLWLSRMVRPEDTACRSDNSHAARLAKEWLKFTGWTECVHARLGKRWTHSKLPNQSILVPAIGDDIDAKQICHLSREAWRIEQWKLLRASGRRELPDIPIDYPPGRVQATRDWLKTATGASRTILLGAAVSPATLHRQAPGNLCTWGCGQLGHWKHIIWECPLRPIKPEHVPVDDLQARWLWPTEERSTKDSKLLDFAKALLEALWQQRHHPAAAAAAAASQEAVTAL
jgi:hypothetical protein